MDHGEKESRMKNQTMPVKTAQMRSFGLIVGAVFFVIGFLLISYKKISKDFIKKNIYFLISLILTILTFIMYLLINDLFNTWLLYLKLPFLQASIAERSIYGNLMLPIAA